MVCWLVLFLALWAQVEEHTFSLKVWHVVGFAVFREVVGEACEEQFTLLFEDDGSSAEEDICLDFVTLFEELDSVLEFEVIVVIVGLGTETNLLDFLLFLIRLRLFLLFLLRVEELLVIDNTTNGRSRRRRYLDEVEILLIGNMHCLLERVDTLFYVVADKAYLLDSADLIVDTMRVLFDNATAARSDGGCCYSFFLLIWVNNQKACKDTTIF